MKYSKLSILFSILFYINNTYALPEDLWVQHAEQSVCESENSPREIIKDKNWIDYPHIVCNGPCPDGTESAWQTPSEGMFSQEGMCGQTSIKNLLKMNCEVSYEISTVDYFVRDLTPGVRPDTFASGINDMKTIMLGEVEKICPNKKYKVYQSRSDDDFVDDLMILLRKKSNTGVSKRTNTEGKEVKTSPVALFIQNPNSGILGAHWVTIVDIENPRYDCKAIVNHWGRQYTVPCEDLKKMARKGNQYPIIGAYTMVGLSNDKIIE